MMIYFVRLVDHAVGEDSVVDVFLHKEEAEAMADSLSRSDVFGNVVQVYMTGYVVEKEVDV